MLVKAAPIIAGASGTLGGNVFQSDRTGLHITKPPCRTRTCHPARLNTFNIFRACVNGWHNHPWTAQELDLWANYAMRHPRTNSLGETFVMTKNQAFFHLNLIRVRNANAITYIPPLD